MQSSHFTGDLLKVACDSIGLLDITSSMQVQISLCDTSLIMIALRQTRLVFDNMSMNWTAQCNDPSSDELLMQAPSCQQPPWINLPLRSREELLAQAPSRSDNSRNDPSCDKLLSQTPLPNDPQWINPPSVMTVDVPGGIDAAISFLGTDPVGVAGGGRCQRRVG